MKKEFKKLMQNGVEGLNLDLEIPVTPEEQASNFIVRLQNEGFVTKNKIYLQNYINGDIGIAFANIKDNYINYVINGSWSEDKFYDVLLVLLRRKQMLAIQSFLKLGIAYDEGKLNNEINAERQSMSTTNNINSEEELDELYAYLMENGGDF